MSGGIYQIRNLINGKVYVGSAVLFKRRFTQHKHLLRHNKHHSQYLQRAWNLYKEESFVFEVIEHIENKALLVTKENEYFQLLKPSYNTSTVHPTRLGSKASLALRKKLSAAHKGKASPRKGIKTGKHAWNRGVPPTAEQRLKMSIAHMGKPNKSRTKFKKGAIPHNIRKVKCIETGQIFNSATEAAEFTGHRKRQPNISAACSKVQKTAYGYTWEYVTV